MPDRRALSGALYGKQLQILHELLPNATHFGALGNPQSVTHEPFVKDTQAAALSIGRTIEVLTAATGREIDAVFARLAAEKRVQGLLISNDFFSSLSAFSWLFWRPTIMCPRFIRFPNKPRQAAS